MLQNLKFVYLSLFFIFLTFNFSYANTDLISPDKSDLMNSDTTFTCGTCYPYCFNIPYADVDNYSFAINGENIPNSELTPCDLDTTYVYSYYALEGNGSSGPYILESWVINGIEVANLQTFYNPQGMADLMNQLDPGGNWAADTDFFFVIGGIPGNSYNNMKVVDTNSTRTLPTNLITTGNGSSLCIPFGSSTVVATEIATGNEFESFDIIVEGIVNISEVVNNGSCDANGNTIPGSIDITVEGGTTPYAYFWQGNGVFLSTDEDLSGLVPGSYSVTVTDADGCSISLMDLAVAAIDCTPDIYVDEFAAGNNDGSTWSNAFINLQDALAATAGLEGTIHVAQGTYFPTDSTLRGVSFEIPSKTTILGGYPTGGGARKPSLYPTVLSGEVDGIPGHEGNSYHVVKIINANDVTIDGFVIQEGNANNSDTFGRARGGGVFCNNSILSLNNSILQNNKALYGGGLFATLSLKVKLTDSEFRFNEANYGSALYLSNATQTFLSRVKVLENNSLIRCAIEVNNATYTNMKNTLIADNTADRGNALALIATNRDQGCDIENSTIIGGVTNRSLIITQVGFGDRLDLNINNSIVAHQNMSFNKNIKVTNNNIFNFNHSNCYFQGSSIVGNGTNNLFSDTAGDLLLNPDFSVQECSPAVNAGDNSLTTTTLDVVENNRIFDFLVDMGAYEAQASCFPSERIGDTSSDQFSIHPNPTKDFINLVVVDENIQSEILDMTGKQVLSSGKKSINIANLPKGMYLLRVYTLDGLLGTKKIIKL